MKAEDILKRKKILERKEQERIVEYEREAKKKMNREKIQVAKNIIMNIKLIPVYSTALNYLGEHAYINDEKTGGFCSVSNYIEHYQDAWGRWKSLLPEIPSFWPDKEKCVPTDKVMPAVLRNYFKKIEKTCDFKQCWWAYGYNHHTSYTLNTSTDYNLVMYFEFN